MEAHLAVKVEDEVNRDLRRDGCSPQPPHPHTRPHRVEAEKVSEQIFTLLELMSYRARWEPVYQLYCTVLYCTVFRWEPVDQLVKLGGVTTLLQCVAMSCDSPWPGRAEIVRSCLEVG